MCKKLPTQNAISSIERLRGSYSHRQIRRVFGTLNFSQSASEDEHDYELNHQLSHLFSHRNSLFPTIHVGKTDTNGQVSTSRTATDVYWYIRSVLVVRRKGFSTTIDSNIGIESFFVSMEVFYFPLHMGAYWFRPDCKRFRSRVVVGRQATLKVDHSFNCRSSVFSGSLVKLLRAMAPVGRAYQSVAKSDSSCFIA